MNELKLVSKRAESIKPLVEGAIAAALRSTEDGIHKTQQRLQAFEQIYGIPTEEFIQRYENDEFQETLEFAEWIGEQRMLKHLQEKAERLREIEFANLTIG
jgi:PAS domain-containing protein